MRAPEGATLLYFIPGIVVLEMGIQHERHCALDRLLRIDNKFDSIQGSRYLYSHALKRKKVLCPHSANQARAL